MSLEATKAPSASTASSLLADVTVVVPVARGRDAGDALCSLARQTYRGFVLDVCSDPDRRGAPWARNQGLRRARTPFVLFSDDDVVWESDAIEVLRRTLFERPDASYAYGSYEIDGRVVGDQPFDAELLRTRNFVSTMSMVRREHCPEWDEGLLRLQDWDLWRTMLDAGRVGAYCGRRIFRTRRREDGITYGTISYEEAARRVRAKHER